MAWLYLVTGSLLVVGDCYAANHPHEHRTTAVVGFGLVGEHQQGLNTRQEGANTIYNESLCFIA